MSTLHWVLDNFGGKLCIIHVHQLSHKSSITNSSSSASFNRPMAHVERLKVERLLDEYLQIFAIAKVPAGKVYIEKDNVAEGIVELIFLHGIKKLVMGAAANINRNGEIARLKSQKAIYVREKAPSACEVWFICDGRLILKRDRNSDPCGEGTSPTSVVDAGFSDPRSPFVNLGHLSLSSSEVNGNVTSMSRERTMEENFGQLIRKFECAVLDADKSKQKAYNESVKHHEAAKTAMDTIRWAAEAYSMELNCRREIEEAMKEKDDEFEELRKELDKERLNAMNQKAFLQHNIASYERNMKEISDELLSTKKMVECFQKECEDLKIERDNAINMVEEIAMSHSEEASSSQSNNFFSEFSVSDIDEATRGNHQSMKIKDGEYGSIYIGSLRKTDVVVKILRQNGLQGPSHFQQEVDLLSKLRHPNLVTFIGACPVTLAIVYEYLPNGSLEDKLSCQENPLSWQTRISIATDLCSVLIFLHSSDPHTVHGNLKPGNILLDANFSCKISDFGICRAHSLREDLPNNADPRRKFPYLDPKFFETGEISPKTDIYSFGIILLQLLTGKAPRNVAADVNKALQDGCLEALLDPAAGDWPYLQAKQLALLALRCCDESQSRRPDLDLDMWTVLKRMRDSCEAPTLSVRPGFGDPSQPPSSFTCPISQDVMENPHMAADGFTYEYANIKRWLDEHNTSPMTNLPLEYLDLVPNRALLSAIEEWQERQ
ncbi:hypothetical protein ACFE04_026536 [Oxalis oulophora]